SAAGARPAPLSRWWRPRRAEGLASSRPGAGRARLGVGVAAQVVEEQRAQRLSELSLAAVNGVVDQPFGGLHVVLGLALVPAEGLGSRDHLEQRPEELDVEVLLRTADGAVVQLLRGEIVEGIGHRRQGPFRRPLTAMSGGGACAPPCAPARSGCRAGPASRAPGCPGGHAPSPRANASGCRSPRPPAAARPTAAPSGANPWASRWTLTCAQSRW